MDFIIKKAMDEQNWCIRLKGGACLMELDFTNDITLLPNTKADLQSMTTKNPEREAGKIEFRLNGKKMKVMIHRRTHVVPTNKYWSPDD